MQYLDEIRQHQIDKINSIEFCVKNNVADGEIVKGEQISGSLSEEHQNLKESIQKKKKAIDLIKSKTCIIPNGKYADGLGKYTPDQIYKADGSDGEFSSIMRTSNKLSKSVMENVLQYTKLDNILKSINPESEYKIPTHLTEKLGII